MEIPLAIKINWNTLSIKEWEEKFSRIPRSNILQSYSYAKAYAPYAKLKPRWGLIEIDGKESGLVQVFEIGLFGRALHALIIDRGPLWFEGAATALNIRRTLDELNRQFPARFGRRRRFIPEVEDGMSIRKIVDQTGFMRQERPGYETVWLDLQLSEEDLRTGLKSNWRNKLSKAEKSGLTVEVCNTPETLGWIAGIYAGDKAARDYGGPKPAFLRRYLPLLAAEGNLLALRAVKDGNPIAFTVIARHGRSATYLIGWSSTIGRECAAHHLLLWEAVKILKRKAVKELDLGGTNDEGAQGVKTFKESMGGDSMRTVGQYR